ncbi:class III signal peptide-containing protein [Candidatus Woesearchaeota archaeon]|nr:class III signal peptide-containing protein [Candidatus Woesearchaeota archaeon]
MNKRGQGATEYLIILAVVVIIALILAGVLGGIPGIGKSSSKQASEAYWGTTDVAITNYYLSAATDVLTVTLRDNLDTSIRVQNISVAGTVNGSSTFTLSPGGTQTTSVAKACTATGDTFEFTPVIIQYSDLSTGANYTFTGTVALSGVCAA